MKNIIKKIFYSFLEKYYEFLQNSKFRILIEKLIWHYDRSKQIYVKGKLKSCGENVNFQLPIIITSPEQVEIGNNVSFAAYVHIWGAGSVKIGNRVMIGSHTAITSITHDYEEDIMYDKSLFKPVIIGNDIWIGSHAVIMPGINIGDGAVIGAGSIVTKDVEPFTIVVGVPAKFLKKRHISNLVENLIDVS